MRILLFGREGQLGWELQRCLGRLGEIIPSDQDELDLSNTEQIPILIDNVQPDVIVNAAAYTDVDGAEIESDLARTINAVAPAVMAEEAKKVSALLIHYSTDYVFDGNKGEAYSEKDLPNPINVYGRSKYEGEQAIHDVGGAYFILRTSWLYSLRQTSFPMKVLKWARNQKVMRVVADQIGSPTWCRMLAEATASLLAVDGSDSLEWLAAQTGIYHVAGKGAVSRYEWGKRILYLDPDRENQIVEEIQPARTEEFPTPAKRPRYSALDCSRFEETFNIQLPDWVLSLERAMLGKPPKVI